MWGQMKKKCCRTIHGNTMEKWKIIKINQIKIGQAKGRLMETDDGVGEPKRGMNCGETKGKAKATFALLGSTQRLSWDARVLLEHDGNALVLGKRRTDRYEKVVWSNIGMG